MLYLIIMKQKQNKTKIMLKTLFQFNSLIIKNFQSVFDF